MNVLIIGAGAIGSLFAGYLAAGGLSVTLVENSPAIPSQINRDGLRIRGVRGEQVVRVPVLRDADQSAPADLIMICVKAYDTAAALQQHAAACRRGGLVLTLQNGIGNVEEIERQVGRERTLAGVTTMGANLAAPGEVIHAGEGETIIGEVNGGWSERARRLAEAFTLAGIRTSVSPNIHNLLWTKLCINAAINPLTALLHVHNGVLVEHEPTQNIMRATVDEVVAVAGELAITLDRELLFTRAIEVARATAHNRSSMLMDVLNGKPTEINYINGAVARIGRERGLTAPVNEMLTNLVLALESTSLAREKN